jgi:hypothetical protein
MCGENNPNFGNGEKISGENNPNVKLTWDQVKEIREKYIPRKYSYKKYSNYYICN